MKLKTVSKCGKKYLVIASKQKQLDFHPSDWSSNPSPRPLLAPASIRDQTVLFFYYTDSIFSSFRQWPIQIPFFQQVPKSSNKILLNNQPCLRYSCITWDFSHYAFSNASLGCLHGMMHSCISYICSTFLQRVLSHVSSNCLFERMHNHIGCICLIFLHYVRSNVPSIGPPERRCIHTGCMCEPSYHH